MKKILQLGSVLLLLFISISGFAQLQSPMDIALRQMEQEYKKWDLTSQDIKDVVVSDQSYSSQNGMTNIYFIQRYQGIEILNAIMNFTLSKEGKVVFTGNRFIPGISSKINSVKPVLNSQQAILAAAK
ncbi:MAG: hypothetical protein JNK41_04235, partial [Saprospiraceae bacterium]|nr:hypothetical protein [Saprospiraceae bacterium]